MAKVLNLFQGTVLPFGFLDPVNKKIRTSCTNDLHSLYLDQKTIMVETTIEKDESVRKEIVLAAQKLIQKFGLKKTTMNEIAAASGKAKSTLYYYYKSKDDVYDAVFHLELENLRIQVNQKVDAQTSMPDKIRTYLIEFYQGLRSTMNLYRVMDLRDLPEVNSRNYFLEVMAYEEHYLIPIFENGVKSGECLHFSMEDVPCFTEVFLAAILGNIQLLLEKEGSYDEDKIAKIVDLLIPAIFGGPLS